MKHTSVGELIEALSLNPLVAPEAGLEREITGGFVGDLLSWVMSGAQPGHAWVTIMSNVNVAAVAMLTDVSCVILAQGVTPDEELLEAAERRGVCLLGSGLRAFELCTQLQALLTQA